MPSSEAGSSVSGGGRPPVAVVVPFFGDRAEAESVLERLGAIETREGDEVLLADNTPEGVAVVGAEGFGVRVLRTRVTASAYAARNEAAEATTLDWLLYLDADCRPVPDILDRYFDPPPGDRAGAVAGEVGGVAGQPGFMPAYARSRSHLDQAWNQRHHVYRPMAVTANLLVRRSAWADIGGFAELVRSGADGDFCWRLAERGWALEYRPQARAPHDHRASIRAGLRKAARDGAANPWLARRWPGFPARVGVGRQLLRAAVAVPAWLVRGKPSRAAFKVFDVLWSVAADLGALTANATPRTPAARSGGATVLLEEFPIPGDPVLGSLPDGARVEALRRPLVQQDWRRGRRLDAAVAEDDGLVDRVRAILWLLRRRRGPVTAALRREAGRTLALAPAAARLARSQDALAAAPGLEPDAALLRALSGVPAAASEELDWRVHEPETSLRD